MYYLAPNLVTTHQVSDDLHDVGIDDWNVHVISKDEAGLKNEKIHSSNWLEATDLLRSGFLGANFGFIIGVLIAGGLLIFKPFGSGIPTISYVFMVVVATGFGAWVGGLTGFDTEHQKLRRFSKSIEEGKFLILIYAPKGQGEKIKGMMQDRHPEIIHIATDRHFFNPFGRVRRKQRADRAQQQ